MSLKCGIINKVGGMIPEQLKQMFGLNSQKDMNMADNIWKMLDDMADSDPEQYQKFIKKNMGEGLADAQNRQAEQDKPFKITPHPLTHLTMTATLRQEPLQSGPQAVVITPQPWQNIKHKLPAAATINLNIMHHQRVREAVGRDGNVVPRYTSIGLKDMEMFYYSLQGPTAHPDKPTEYYFSFIVSSQCVVDLMREGQVQGRRALMGLAVAYTQQRLAKDKNPLLKVYNPQQYQRLAYYGIEKHSIEVGERKFEMPGGKDVPQIVLERQVDKSRRVDKKAAQEQKQQKAGGGMHQTKPEVKTQIKFKADGPPAQVEPPVVQQKPKEQPPKKVLIEVLKEEPNTKQDEIAYEMHQDRKGYQLQFLLPGIKSIAEVELQVKEDQIRLTVENKKPLDLPLGRKIRTDWVRAKLKKKAGKLAIDAPYMGQD